MKYLLLIGALVQALDIGSTCIALNRGMREANPMLPKSCGGIMATKGAITILSLVTAKRLSKDHPRWAVAVAVTSTTSGGLGFTWNVVKLSK